MSRFSSPSTAILKQKNSHIKLHDIKFSFTQRTPYDEIGIKIWRETANMLNKDQLEIVIIRVLSREHYCSMLKVHRFIPMY